MGNTYCRKSKPIEVEKSEVVTKEDSAFECCYMDCDESFKHVRDYKIHQRAHKSERQYRCNYIDEDGECNHMFRSVEDLKSHKVAHAAECVVVATNSSESTVFVCFHICEDGRECLDEFKTTRDFQIHLQTHTDKRQYGCDYIDDDCDCSRAFTTIDALENHRQSHDGETLYKCSYVYEDGGECMGLFASRHKLNVHVLLTHYHH